MECQLYQRELQIQRVPIKIPLASSAEIEKTIPNFVKTFKGPKQPKPPRKGRTKFEASYFNLKLATKVVKLCGTVLGKDRFTDRWNRTEPRHRASRVSQLTLRRSAWAIQCNGKGFPVLCSVLRTPRRESWTPTRRGMRSTVTQHQLDTGAEWIKDYI